MMKSFLSYDSVGNILQMQATDTSCQSIIPVPTGGGVLMVDKIESNDNSWMQKYILSGVLTQCSTFTLTTSKTSFTANGTDEVTITGIPSGASATITGVMTAGPETITDGELIITSTTPGQIVVVISLKPQYVTWSVTLNAT